MSDITLLDGSIGQELVRRAGGPPTPLWSTSVMLDRPELVGALHRDYFAAGATVATVNSYAVLPDRLVGTPLEGRQRDLLDMALEQADAARAAHGGGRIAGAIGPLGATYRPDLAFTPDQARVAYRLTREALAPRVNILLAETVASLREARNIVEVFADAGPPLWLAVTVDDDDGTRLRSGEPVAELAPLAAHPGVAAVLVNCSRPEAVDRALPLIAPFGKPFGGYANGFTAIAPAFLEQRPTSDLLEVRHDLDPAAYAEFAMGWVAMGATIVGGCCEVGPDHIAELARRLRAAGHRVV